jgi:hypothetical protein
MQVVGFSFHTSSLALGHSVVSFFNSLSVIAKTAWKIG